MIPAHHKLITGQLRMALHPLSLTKISSASIRKQKPFAALRELTLSPLSVRPMGEDGAQLLTRFGVSLPKTKLLAPASKTPL